MLKDGNLEVDKNVSQKTLWKHLSNTNLVEISLQEELLEDVDEFWHGRKPFFEVLDQLHGPQAVDHVEADVDLDVRQAIRQFDDRHLRANRINQCFAFLYIYKYVCTFWDMLSPNFFIRDSIVCKTTG